MNFKYFSRLDSQVQLFPWDFFSVHNSIRISDNQPFDNLTNIRLARINLLTTNSAILYDRQLDNNILSHFKIILFSILFYYIVYLLLFTYHLPVIIL